jgi:hypothetical protein
MLLYLCAGLYAEGPTDYAFLERLSRRVLFEIATRVAPGNFEIADTLGIDAGTPRPRRAERISTAIEESWDACTLFIIHSDGAGDPASARAEKISPAIEQVRERHPDAAIAACIPVREVEAWLLADATVFESLVASGSSRARPLLPPSPEKVLDPKRALDDVLRSLKLRVRASGDYYAIFGERIDIAALRRLSAFRDFENELADAVGQIAGVR